MLPTVDDRKKSPPRAAPPPPRSVAPVALIRPVIDRRPARPPRPPQDFGFLAAAAPRVSSVEAKLAQAATSSKRSTPPPPPFAASVRSTRVCLAPQAPAKGVARRDEQLTLAVTLRAKGSAAARSKPGESGARPALGSRESTRAVELRAQSLGPVLEWLERLASRKR